MRKHLRKALIAVAIAAVVTAIAASIGSASVSKQTSVKAGGTYKVGWESAFGFTDAFDVRSDR